MQVSFKRRSLISSDIDRDVELSRELAFIPDAPESNSVWKFTKVGHKADLQNIFFGK